MAVETDWIATTEPELLINFVNLDNNIDEYVNAFGISVERLAKIHGALRAVIAAIRYSMQVDIFAKAVTTWKKNIKNNRRRRGTPATMPPALSPFEMPDEAINGAIDYLRDEAKLWKLSDGYRQDAGKFLRIVPREKLQRDTPLPVVKWQAADGFKIICKWRKAGFKMIKFRYSPKGSDDYQYFVRGGSPANLQIVPQNPDTPENGFVQSIYIDGDDKEIGEWSDPHLVTLT